MNIIEMLSASIREAAEYNQNTQAAPAAILWTDKERQWELALPGLQQLMPELLVLGDYEPEKLTGPAIWLKCAIAGTLEDKSLPEDQVPVLYLPGVSRTDLRAIEACPEDLKPLAELQYRGALWSQYNGRDWTIFAWLKTSNGGLGLDLAKDDDTLAALQRALPHLLNADLKELQGKRIEAIDINQLLTIDAVKDLLLWMNDPKAIAELWDEARWHSFEEVILKEYDFSIASEGELGAAERLAAKQGAWAKVWNRFEESWHNYPQLLERLETVKPVADMFADVTGYPQYNREQEENLLNQLLKVSELSPAEARATIRKLESEHGKRRQWLWAEMEKSPLAMALEPLMTLTEKTEKQLGGMTLQTMAEAYSEDAWQADAAALDALAIKGSSAVAEAIESALKSLYTPWLSACAEHFQKLVAKDGYTKVEHVNPPQSTYEKGGECLFFVDGLRFDTAKKLQAMLEKGGLKVDLKNQWTALPTVTSTAKASVTPVSYRITGRTSDKDFVPSLIEKESAWSQHYLKQYLEKADWQFLAPGETGNSNGFAWVETGDLDHYGHEHGLRLARELDVILGRIEERVAELLAAGWKTIRIVTDHGWLLVPGKMPKASLDKHLTETRWGRCALLKDNVTTEALTVGWHWNQDVPVAMAPGIASFIAGKVYDHGGLSLQECLTPALTITSEQQATEVQANIRTVKWIGLRCKVEVQTDAEGVCAQIRKNPAMAETGVTDIKRIKDGKVALFVEDDDLEGEATVLVLVDSQGNLLAKQPTFIGGE